MLLYKKENSLSDASALRTAALALDYYGMDDHPEKNYDLWQCTLCHDTESLTPASGIIKTSIDEIIAIVEANIGATVDSHKAYCQYYMGNKIELIDNDNEPSLPLTEKILFSNQEKWVAGKTVNDVNENLKKLLKDENINIDFEKCTNDKNIEDYVLNDRIEGVKKFKVNATPTIIINNKKFEKPLNFKNLKNSIEKLI